MTNNADIVEESGVLHTQSHPQNLIIRKMEENLMLPNTLEKPPSRILRIMSHQPLSLPQIALALASHQSIHIDLLLPGVKTHQ